MNHVNTARAIVSDMKIVMMMWLMKWSKKGYRRLLEWSLSDDSWGNIQFPDVDSDMIQKLGRAWSSRSIYELKGNIYFSRSFTLLTSALQNFGDSIFIKFSVSGRKKLQTLTHETFFSSLHFKFCFSLKNFYIYPLIYFVNMFVPLIWNLFSIHLPIFAAKRKRSWYWKPHRWCNVDLTHSIIVNSFFFSLLRYSVENLHILITQVF